MANDILAIYNKAKFPKYLEPETLLPFTPDVRQIFLESRDAQELEHYWTQFRELTGAQYREAYLGQLKHHKEIARLNGYEDAARHQTASYESETFIEDIAEVYEGLRPLYEQLHAYLRDKLKNE